MPETPLQDPDLARALAASMGYFVDSMEGLRQHPGPPASKGVGQIFLRGYWRPGDGGEGHFLWEPTSTVGLKQTMVEQEALVGERPEVFEVQFTAGGFGWVVVHLDGVERDELAELVFEAWRLSAPVRILEARGDKLPV